MLERHKLSVISVVVLVVPALAQGPTLLVPSQHATIQAAIDAASAGTTILVDPGTYLEVIDLDGGDRDAIQNLEVALRYQQRPIDQAFRTFTERLAYRTLD